MRFAALEYPTTALIGSFILTATIQQHLSAQLAIEIPSQQVAAGQNGSFDILVSNRDMPDTTIGAFNVQLQLPTDSPISFTSAEIALDDSYLFASASFVENTGVPYAEPFTATEFVAADLYEDLLDPDVFGREILTGETWSLGRVSFSVSPNAAPQDVPIAFVLDGTSLSDDVANDVSFAASNGIIHIVPEPSSALLLALGALLCPMIRNALSGVH